MRRSILIGCVALVGLAAHAMAAEHQGVDLAKLAGWDIVVAEDAIPSEALRGARNSSRSSRRRAALELPIVKAADRADRHVLVGASKCHGRRRSGIRHRGHGPEELRIVVRDNIIAIAGGRPRGTLYGVYTFLEDYLGVRFLTADHTHVPKLSAPGRGRPGGPLYEPPLSFRWSYYGETNRSPMLAARLRVNTVAGDAKYGGKTGQSLISHTFGSQIPTGKYGKEHPEYFALRDGKRLSDVKDDWSQSEPCLTNPDVLKIVTEAVLAELKAHPERRTSRSARTTTRKYCQCPNCKAIDDREGTPMGSLLEFVNAVADEVAKEHPTVKVGTLSYWYTRKPPKTLKPRPNVQIQLCSIECCMIHPINDPDLREERPVLPGHGRVGQAHQEHLHLELQHELQQLPAALPEPAGDRAEHPLLRGPRRKGIFMQAAGNATGAELSDLRNYVMANLLWDPDAQRPAAGRRVPRPALRQGRAADPAVHQLVPRPLRLPKGIHRNCFGRAADYAIDDEIAKAAMDAFAEALAWPIATP